MMKRIYAAKKIFTGEDWLEDHAIIAEAGVITALVASDTLASSTAELHEAEIIVPAFIDLQIYGAYGKLFAAYPEAATLEKTYQYCRKGGAAYFQPTVATNDLAVFRQCIDAVRQYRESGGKGVLGLHLEGPWINPAKRGAHAERFIQLPDTGQVRQLLDYGGGVISMITLAPELCDRGIMQIITEAGIKISAGHSNATYEQAMESFDRGIGLVTHLFNAMSAFQHRAPGLAGAALDHPDVMASIIPDGYHVNWPAIRIAKKVMAERLFAITDAVTETAEGIYRHSLKGDRYEANGVLSGSALTMFSAFNNLVIKAGIERDEALRMCSLYPARAAGQSHRLGMIRAGYDASLLCLDQENKIVEVIN